MRRSTKLAFPQGTHLASSTGNTKLGCWGREGGGWVGVCVRVKKTTNMCQRQTGVAINTMLATTAAASQRVNFPPLLRQVFADRSALLSPASPHPPPSSPCSTTTGRRRARERVDCERACGLRESAWTATSQQGRCGQGVVTATGGL